MKTQNIFCPYCNRVILSEETNRIYELWKRNTFLKNADFAKKCNVSVPLLSYHKKRLLDAGLAEFDSKTGLMKPLPVQNLEAKP